MLNQILLKIIIYVPRKSILETRNIRQIPINENVGHWGHGDLTDSIETKYSVLLVTGTKIQTI